MRIISGNYGGRSLKTLEGLNTRPTSDRLKETIFNIIGPYFKGGLVLDLYAGTGALGIEAVSRGMDKAILVDSSKKAKQIILENIEVTKEKHKFELIHSKVDYAIRTLTKRREKFTLIFLDPPYAEEKVEKDIEQILENDLLADVALIVCEVGISVELPSKIEEIELWDQRKYKNKKIVIYQKLA